MIFLAITQYGYAATIKTDGSSLKAFQTIVGGNVDVVTTREGTYLPHEFDVFVNDEGLFRPDFCMNLIASYFTGQTLVGPVVLSNVNIKTGETLGLTEQDIASLSENMDIDTNNGEHYSADEIAHLITTVDA
jgi:hypothetical protein